MPDPVLYTQAMAVAAVVSALWMLPAAGARSMTPSSRLNVAYLLAVGVGLLIGYRVLHLRCHWPPVNGLDRLLTLVLPVAFSIEVFAGWPRAPRWLVQTLRIGLILSTPRVLLHGSIYLGGPHSPWTVSGSWSLLALTTAILAVAWWLMTSLINRSPATPALIALALATQTTAVAIILGGYVTGCAAALPLTAALLGTALSAIVCRMPSSTFSSTAFGVTGLFGLLFVGRFFGGLTTPLALAILFSPTLCWAIEISPLKCWAPRPRTLLGLVLVAIPLIVVLALMKRTFDRETRPLLGAAAIQTEMAVGRSTPVNF